jgi:hypothetical protein
MGAGGMGEVYRARDMRQYGIELIAPDRSNCKNKTQTDAVCAGTAEGGKSSGYSLGCRTFDDWSFDTNGMATIS